MRALAAAVACGVFLSGGTAVAGDGVWTGSGPYGGRVHEIQFVPDSSVAYATTWGGVFRSDDDGDTWIAADSGIVADTYYGLPLMFDAERPATLYTTDSWARLYRSDNGGEAWTILPHDLPDDVYPAAFADVPVLACALLLGTATSAGGHGTMLFRSDDCGLSFRQIGAGLPDDATVRAVGFLPDDVSHSTVLAAVDNVPGDVIWRSSNGGENFVAVASPFYEVNQFSFGAGNEVWAASGSYSIVHSADGGLNWADTGAAGYVSVAADPAVAERAWIGGSNPGWQVVRADYDGSTPYLFTNYDHGLSGNPGYLGNATPAPAGVDRIAWDDDATPGLFVSTQGSGVFKLIEGSSPHWEPVARGPAGVGIRAVAIHPTQPSVVFAGQDNYSTSSPAFYRTANGGADWTASNDGLRAADILAILLDPTTAASLAATTLYAGGRSAPNGDEYRNYGLYRSDDGGTSWITLDGDLPAVEDHYIGETLGLALDPRSCAAPPTSGPCSSGPLQTVYAVAQGRIAYSGGTQRTHRVLRSADRGAHWVDLSGNPGFPASTYVVGVTLPTLTGRGGDEVVQEVTPTVVAVDPANQQRIFVGTRARFEDSAPGSGNEIDTARESGLFVSDDGGATWSRLGATQLPGKIDATVYPNATRDVVDLLVDPADGDVLWIGLRDDNENGTSTIWRSADAGATWAEAYTGINETLLLRDLAFDPQNPDVLYAAAGGTGGNPGAIYRGVWNPGAQSILWLSVSIGLPAESAHAVAVDPLDPDVLHAGTDTGVYSIKRRPDQDGDGIPDDVENQAPGVPGGLPAGDGNGDGVLDSLQRGVGSIGVILRGAGVAVTTDVVSGEGSPDCIAGDPQTVDVTSLPGDAKGNDPTDDGRRFYQHSYGINVFEILGCEQSTVQIRYHGVDFTGSQWSFRVFAPLTPGTQDSIAWRDFSKAAALIAPDTWELDLTAGGFGSYRPENDSILVVGSPACLALDLFSDGFEADPEPSSPCGN